jgi:group I intron endonuclease
MTRGIYAIINTITREEYIGQSPDIERRWDDHIRTLKRGRGNKILQNAWNTYGEDAFELEIVEEVCSTDSQELFRREAYHMEERKPVYNIHPPSPNHVPLDRAALTIRYQFRMTVEEQKMLEALARQEWPGSEHTQSLMLRRLIRQEYSRRQREIQEANRWEQALG